MRYQVFIEGTVERSPQALSRVATSIAGRYGLPAQAIVQRMSSGRFRVKSGIDRQTAYTLAKDLASMGAVALIANEVGEVIARLPQQVPTPAPTPAPAPASAPALAPAGVPLQSGLAAAQSGGVQADLGALGAAMDGLTLATLDGETDRPSVDEEVTRPAVSMSAFAPPEAEAQDLQLAVDLPKPPAPARVAASEVAVITDARPPVEADQQYGRGRHSRPLPGPAQRPSQSLSGPARAAALPSSGVPHAGSFQDSASYTGADASAPVHPARGGVAAPENPLDKVRTRLADMPRVRFATGVFLALFLGFLPVMIFANISAGSYADMDAELRAEQDAATDPEAWDRLDEIRAATLERKESKQRNIALSGMFIWVLVSGGLAFLWFRKIDWDFYRTPPARIPSSAPAAS